jgi:glutamate 5-kinase
MGTMNDAARIQRLVVKVGSAVLAPGGLADPVAMGRIADELAGLRRAGVGVVLVSSGAVASGFRALGLTGMPRTIRQKQAAAALGQPALMRAWAEGLGVHGVQVAQVLLTTDDFGRRERFLNAKHTIETLMAAGAVPVINENDSVVFDEIKLGDNDRLSALVASAIDADLLVLLSVAPGLMDMATGDVIPRVESIAAARRFVDASASSGVGTGGMATKLDAAAIVTERGIPAHLTRGPTDAMPDPITRVLAGLAGGTRFEAAGEAGGRADGSGGGGGSGGRRSRKSWIAHATRASGTIEVDDGAAKAIRERGASLLPGGVVRVEGRFEAGAAVEIVDSHGGRIARGLASYSSAEIARIRGVRSDAIAGILGYSYADEVVHRDDLELISPTA